MSGLCPRCGHTQPQDYGPCPTCSGLFTSSLPNLPVNRPKQDPRDARIAALGAQLAALPSRERILEYQRAAEALRDAVGIDDAAAIPDRYMDLDILPPLIPDDGA